MLYQSPLGIISIKVLNGFVTEIIYTNDDITNLLVNETKFTAADKKVYKKCIAQFDEYFSGKRKIFELPVKQAGTQFQHKVWNELINIPYGKTLTYMQMAQKLGDVKAIRAAASANGKNKLNIIVPCHRVIGTDGTLTGYGGGLPRKKWLLNHENKYENGASTLF